MTKTILSTNLNLNNDIIEEFFNNVKDNTVDKDTTLFVGHSKIVGIGNEAKLTKADLDILGGSVKTVYTTEVLQNYFNKLNDDTEYTFEDMRKAVNFSIYNKLNKDPELRTFLTK